MFLGLGFPEWVTILGIVGALALTLWMMARASVAYEKARKAREADGATATGKEET